MGNDLDNRFWYVVSVKSGSELKIVNRLNFELAHTDIETFIPQKTCIYRRQGVKTEFKQICFPGYIFIQSNISAIEFRQAFLPVASRITDFFKILHYGDQRSDITMRKEEVEKLSNIIGSKFLIDISKIYKNGDFIKIVSGSLLGQEGIIKRIMSQKKVAVIEITMFNKPIEVVVALEFIKYG